MTEACIVGSAHSPFGKLDDPDIEALIGRVARGPRSTMRASRRPMLEASFISLFNNGFSLRGLPGIAGAAACAGAALPPDHAFRECLRLGVGRSAWRA